MDLHTLIKQEVQKIPNQDISKGSIANLALLSISQMDYFSDSYYYFSMTKCRNIDDNQDHFVIKTSSLNDFNGFKYNLFQKNYIDVLENFEEQYDPEPLDVNNPQYLLLVNKKILDCLINIIDKSKNFNDLNKQILEQQKNDTKFLHLAHLLTQNNKSLHSLLNASIQLSQFNEHEILQPYYFKNSFHKYYDDVNIKKIQDRFIENNLPTSSFSDFENFSRFLLLKKFATNNFSNYDLKSLFFDSKLLCVPQDIEIMINNNEKQGSILNAFRKKYSSHLLSTLFQAGGQQERRALFIEKHFSSLKENALNATPKHQHTVESLLEQYNEIISPIINKATKCFPELISRSINFEIIQANKVMNNFTENPTYNIMKDKSKLSIFKEYEKNIMSQGLYFLNNEGINNYSQHNKTFILMKDNNQIVGEISIVNKNNNISEILSVCIGSSHKQKGLLRQLYQKLAEYAIENNIILFSQVYSQEGKTYIPKVKNDIIRNNPNLIFLRCENLGNSNEQKLESSLNQKLYEYINNINQPIDLPKFNRHYKKALSSINEVSQNTTDIYSAADILFQDLKSNISLKSKKKQYNR